MDVFRRQKIALCFLGIYIPGTYNSKIIQWIVEKIYVYFVLSYICVGFYLYSRGCWLYMSLNFMNRIVSLAFAISSVAALAKIVVLHRNRYFLKDILDNLCYFVAETERSKRVGKVIRGYEMAVLAILVFANLKMPFEQGRVEPYFAQYQKGGAWIKDWFIYIGYAIYTLGINVFVDTLFLFICNQICHKLLIMITTINNVGSKKKLEIQNSLILTSYDASDENKIIASVEEHNKLLNIIRQMEWLFDEIIVFQALYTFGSLCLILFASSQTDNMQEDGSKIVSMIISLSVELFLFCWGGEMIKTHCENVRFAVYDNFWYKSNHKVCKSLNIMMSFASQPITMKSAKLFHLNLETYEKVVRETFSFYTIMYRFFNQKD